MTKMIKLSLATAVAVAGLGTSASATSLVEMVKDTSMTGYIRYRLETTEHDSKGKDINDIAGDDDTRQETKMKAVMNFKTKVNDTVTSNFKLVGKYNTDDNGTVSKNGTFDLNQANFIMNTGYATMIAGLQTTQSPFAANNGDTRSDGLTALIPAGPVTVAAAHYINTHAEIGTVPNDISALGLIGTFGPVNAELWTARVASSDGATNSSFANSAILLSAEVAPNTTVYFHHAEGDTGSYIGTTKQHLTFSEAENTQLKISTNLGYASMYATYVKTGEHGGDVTLDGDTDGKLNTGLEQVGTLMADEADIYIVGVMAPVGPVTLGAHYLDANMASATAEDKSEMKFSVDYAMSKNFKLSAWASFMDMETTRTSDNDKTRLEAKYTF